LAADAPVVAATTLLLPARRRFGGQTPGAPLAALLGRADRLADGEPGERAQLLRHVDLLPRGWPIAAITRALDADDAALHAWLRADPTHVRPDMTGARVLAIGDVGLTTRESEALVAALRTTFGDAGFQLSAPRPDRWYVALPREAKIPAFAAPEDVLGDDLAAHLPDGPEARRWRALLNEAQVILHNHPVNAERVAGGRPAVNSLTFWGGGRLPDHVRMTARTVTSDAADLRALAKLAGVATDGEPAGPVLEDLRATRDLAHVAATIVARFDALAAADTLQLDFADGTRFALRRGQRFRFWRRPLAAFA